jgi:hypothetical protein
LIQAESSNRNGASSQEKGHYHQKVIGGPMIVIDWIAFRNTMAEWLA